VCVCAVLTDRAPGGGFSCGEVDGKKSPVSKVRAPTFKRPVGWSRSMQRRGRGLTDQEIPGTADETKLVPAHCLSCSLALYVFSTDQSIVCKAPLKQSGSS